MNLLDASDVFGYTIFCDDIRVEIGNKITYVGSYSGRMVVHGQFPVVIPKLCLAVIYFQRRSKVILPVRINILLPGDTEERPSIHAEMPEDASRQAIESARELAERMGTEASSSYTTALMQFALSPLSLLQPGLMKVRAVRGEDLVRLGSMEIVSAALAGSEPPVLGPLP
jgi:hypothetical protein